ncbi:hypothetical protein IWW43_004879 [Coemansia sp. RSA 1935]|nr:hypothetical protein GGH97_002485 [Coemansia sp. RSA 475]KAJ2272123.1 hypothetical protein J3F81_003181 [Coemansia sp. RSA 371]KAJ2529480.1 hypothetical protein IWW43_004879 [Coemansia sp. RSA 1935]
MSSTCQRNILLLVVFALAICAEQTSLQTLQPYKARMETTYRPEITDTASATYSPIPFTPDLGEMVNSIASDSSVSDAMRQARMGWGLESTRDEL